MWSVVKLGQGLVKAVVVKFTFTAWRLLVDVEVLVVVVVVAIIVVGGDYSAKRTGRRCIYLLRRMFMHVSIDSTYTYLYACIQYHIRHDNAIGSVYMKLQRFEHMSKIGARQASIFFLSNLGNLVKSIFSNFSFIRLGSGKSPMDRFFSLAISP